MLTVVDNSPLGKIVPVGHDNTYFDEYSMTWNGKPTIFSKFDYFAAVFYNVTIVELFHAIQLDKFYGEYLSDFFNSIDLVSEPTSVLVMHKYNGVKIKIPYAVYMKAMKYFTCEDVLENSSETLPLFTSYRFESIRLDISGEGMDFMRRQGLDPDKMVVKGFSFDFPLAGYHITRCDFAFDLIDYHGDFYDELLQMCIESSDPDTVRVSTMGKGAVSWSGRVGGERTVYLGSVNANKMLRVYDKKFQFMHADQWLTKCPYRNGDKLPDTWIRIELQTRRNIAIKLLGSNLSKEEQLKFIYENYAIRKVHTRPSGERRAQDPYDAWLSLFDWERIRVLLARADECNGNFVQSGSAEETS